MPISLGEWRARIGRFVHWKQVVVDFDKLIETILERRRQLFMREVDDILENTRKNAEKQEARGENANTFSGSARSPDDQCASDSSGSCTATVPRRAGPSTRDRDQSNAPHLLSTSPLDADLSISALKDDEVICDRPTSTIHSSTSTSHGSTGQGHQCTESLNPNPLLNEMYLRSHILLSEQVSMD